MKIILYFMIFISKIIENALSTLRLIVVANGKKTLGAVLQFVITLVWALVTGVVVVNIAKDPLKIFFLAFGSFIGSYTGSFIEERLAIGNNMLTVVINNSDSKKVINNLKKYKFTVLKGHSGNNKKSVLMIMIPRKHQQEVIDIINNNSSKSVIITEKVNAFNQN